MAQVSLEALTTGAQDGLLVSFPTDTVPALATLPEKAELIYAAKERSLNKPLILMAARAEDIWPYVQGSDVELKIWQEVANKYWPGALTLVLPASIRLPKQMNHLKEHTIGVRVPNSAIARTILAQTGPLATTSANLSGQPPLLTGAEIALQFPQALVLATTEEVNAMGAPSTVAKWTGNSWEILRPGMITLENLASK